VQFCLCRHVGDISDIALCLFPVVRAVDRAPDKPHRNDLESAAVNSAGEMSGNAGEDVRGSVPFSRRG
jgi:hypothetical protein